MKVLQVITSLRMGGAERLLADLAPRMQAAGVEVRVLSVTSTMPLATVLREQSVAVRSLDCNGTIYSADSVLRAIRDTRREITQFNPDVIHSHLYLADLVVRCAAPGNARLVTTLHNIDRWWNERHRLRSLAKTWVDSKTARMRATRAIAVSSAVASAAQWALKLSQPRCRVIRNGIDEHRFAWVGRKLDDAPIVIQVGRFYAQKGHRISLLAFKEVLRQTPHARMQLVGDGPLENEMKALATSLGIAARVEFLGACTDVPALLARAHVFWMPSDWEGLPLACMEAMSTGLPVVASAVGGIPEIVRDDTGDLIAPGDAPALARATTHIFDDYPAALARADRGARLIRERYTVGGTARAYLSSYQDLVDRSW